MRIAVVDDLPADRAWLAKKLKDYMDKRAIAYTLFPFASGEDFLESAKCARFDIVFMDIYMNGMTGIQTADALRYLDMDCKLVFLTTSEEHLRQGYSMNPCHYLIKPPKDEDFLRAMENCRMKPRYAVPFLEVTTDRVKHSLDTALIAYIDFCQRSAFVHLTDRVFSVSGSFGAVTKPLLSDKRFLLCMKGILVNMDHIYGHEGNAFLLKNGERLPITVRGKAKIIGRFSAYKIQRLGESP